MPIVLTLDDRSGSAVRARETRTLSVGTLSIGRGPGNDWVLADPDRHLSKTHCMVSQEGGRWYLTDLSTNGLYVNGAREPTRRDARLALTDGDSFRLGDYVITVEEMSAFAAPPRAAPPASRGEEPDPLGGDLLDDPFGEPTPARAAAFRHPLPQAAPPPRSADPFDALDTERRGESMLDDELFGGGSSSSSWTGPAQSDHVDAPFGAMPPPRPLAPPPPGPDAFDFDALLGDTPLEEAADPFVVPASPSSPAPTVAPAPPAAATRHGDDAEAGLAAFLAGAGVPDLRTGRDAEASLRAAGAVFRALVEGIREVLMSRSAIKNELRVEQTMMRARDNNALKFSVTPEEALAALLLPERTGYKPALDATREAFADVRSHEIAVMAGMQTALLGLLRRFDPDALEKRLQPGRLDSLLPGARRARIWELFCATYKDIAREAEDDFQSVFGREFARAYDAQMKKL